MVIEILGHKPIQQIKAAVVAFKDGRIELFNAGETARVILNPTEIKSITIRK